MSAHKHGDEVPSAGAAAAPAPSAGDGRQSTRDTLEKEIRELEADIKELRKKIKLDEDKADLTKNEDLELALRRAIASNTERLQGLEQDMRDLRKKIERPTAAGGRSPTSCLPLRSLIGLLASQGIARAPLATRI